MDNFEWLATYHDSVRLYLDTQQLQYSTYKYLLQ